MKRVIVPFFISHQGCPHQCVFCDQRAISGKTGNIPSSGEILATIDEWRRSSGYSAVEVAFFGGTFTSLPVDTQIRLLLPLRPLLKSGEVSGIRVSTRPDSVTPEIALLLRQHGVGLVELGVQSMNDRVLASAGRGHTAARTLEAFTVLHDTGLKVGAQLMPGLPGDTPAGAVASLKDLLPLQPDLLRIYPALVLKGTELAHMYAEGSYTPLTLDAAVDICKVMLHIAASSGIPVVRVGLQPTDDLYSAGTVLAGPCHPAFRELADGERWFDLMEILLREAGFGGEAAVSVSPENISVVAGQNRRNIRRIEEEYGIRVVSIRPDAALGRHGIMISSDGREVAGDLLRHLDYNENLQTVREKN